ncbi:hypothetical protein CCR91_21235 [Thiorhodovibrio winogradskyi]|nr:hypothetical protein [Thiorhodovibrio winogradskyi]
MHAGQRILLIDDDTVLRALQLPNASKQPIFRIQPAPGVFFPDSETANSCLQPFDGDPLAAHADYLGLPIVYAIKRMTDSRLEQRLLENQSIDDIPPPKNKTGILRYTHNGFLGDTGTTSDHLRLYKLRLDAPELVVDPEAYLRFRHAPRFAFGSSDSPQILSGTHLHHATCVGLDLSDLMPPVIPTGRSEDGLLASLMRFLYPADAGLRHAFALEHGLEAVKPWAFEAELLFKPFDVSTAASLWTSQLPSGLDLTPSQRWSLLAQTLRNSVESGTLPVRLAGMLEQHRNESLSFQFAVIHGELAIHTANTPNGIKQIPDDSPWRQELEAISYRLSQQLRDSHSAPDTSPELDRICSKIDTYSQALAPWTRAFESSQQ